MHIHPVFHVSLLESHVANKFPDRVVPPLLPTQVDDHPEFEMQSIVDSRYFHCELQYKVDWVGYHHSDLTWEPVENLDNASLAIVDFHEQYPDKPRPRA